jgi:hypothetical protein
MHIKTKITGVLMLAVFVFPGISLAQTQSAASLQAELQSLLAQVSMLEAQLAAQGGSTSWCYTFNSNLSIGMSGPAVTALQTALQKDGEFVQVTGTFDDQTAAAVTGFQEKYTSVILTPNGLTNGTGYAGEATRVELNSLFGCRTVIASSTVFSAPTSSAHIQILSPTGSAIWQIGTTQTIRWTSDLSGVSISLVCASGVSNCSLPNGWPFVLVENEPGSGSYNWPLQVAGSEGLVAGIVAPGSYQIKVSATGDSQSSLSAPVSIASSGTSQPYIDPSSILYEGGPYPGMTIVMLGSGFGNSPVISISGNGYPPTTVTPEGIEQWSSTSTRIDFALPSNIVNSTSTYSVVIINNGMTSNPVNITPVQTAKG